ncbi:right-handed parallel beta-helix repeat-containing protein, partial [Nanoarchaeota archaeon]
DSGGGLSDNAYGIAADNLGNIIAVGQEGGATEDWLVRKYHPNGTLAWSSTYNSGVLEYAWKVDTDSSRNIIVVGMSDNLSTSRSGLLIKYDENGNHIWNTSIVSPDGLTLPEEVIVDPFDEIIVAAASYNLTGNGNDDFLIAKFDSSGNQLWNRTPYGVYSASAKGVAVNDSGYIVATGRTDIGGTCWSTIKYNLSGYEMWNKTCDVVGTPYSISVDSSNEMIVTGTKGTDIFTLKYTDDDYPPEHTAPVINTTYGYNFTTDGLNCVPQNAYDPNGNDLVYIIHWFNESVEVPELLNFTRVAAGNTSISENWSCSVIPNDGGLNGTELFSGNLTVRPENDVPNTTIVFLNSSSLSNFTYDNISCYATGVDEDNENMTANWVWKKNGAEQFTGSTNVTNNTFTLITTLNSENTTGGDNWTCAVTMYDGEMYELSGESATMEIVNTEPNTTEFVLNSTGLNYTASDTLTCYAKAVDNEDSSLTAYYVWYNGSTQALSGNVTIANDTMTLISSLGSGNTTPGETWNCSVMIYDGSTNESEWSSASQKIGSSCGETLQSGGYVLNGDISSAGTCFTVGGNNIALDCKGYRITGPDGSTDYRAIEANTGAATRFNFTLKNCWIQDFYRGVFRYFSDSLFYNNTFNSTYDNGISLSETVGVGENNNITQNTFMNTGYWSGGINTGSEALYITQSDDNVAHYNNFINNRGTDIDISSTSENNQIRHNVIDKNNVDDYVVDIRDAVSPAIFENNTIINVGT